MIMQLLGVFKNRLYAPKMFNIFIFKQLPSDHRYHYKLSYHYDYATTVTVFLLDFKLVCSISAAILLNILHYMYIYQ